MLIPSLNQSLCLFPGIIHLQRLVHLPKFIVDLFQSLIPVELYVLSGAGGDKNAKIQQVMRQRQLRICVQRQTHRQVFMQMIYRGVGRGFDVTYRVLFQRLDQWIISGHFGRVRLKN